MEMNGKMLLLINECLQLQCFSKIKRQNLLREIWKIKHRCPGGVKKNNNDNNKSVILNSKHIHIQYQEKVCKPFRF